MRNIFFAFTIFLSSCLFFSCSNKEIYKDASMPVERRVDDLLKRMTTEEKLGQLICPYGWPMYEKTVDSTTGKVTVSESQAFRDFIEKQHGGMLWATFRADPWTQKTLETGLDPSLAAETYNKLQKYAIEHSRLGIPIILAEEAPHGHMAIGTTVFPTGIGMASTWDRDLMTKAGGVVAQELRAQGAHISYGPVMDLSREPRWSRVEESYGEDPYLTGEIGAAFVRGSAPKAIGYEKGVINTIKHLVAYGTTEGGHNGTTTVLGDRELQEMFLPPIRKVIDAGALSLMTAYSSIDGIPCTANRKILTDEIRNEWGFDGFVVSDLYAIDGLAGGQHVASSREEAGKLALHAGVDVDLGGNCFWAMKNPDQKELDQAVSRVLRLKFQLGLFDNPYVDASKAASQVRTSENVAVALQAAREGTILLKNDGVLPLSRNARVAVIGPNADVMYNQLGDYTAPQDPDVIITPLEGIVAKIGASNVNYAKGCAVRDPDASGIPAAVAAARKSDVAIVFVGGSSARDFKTKYIDTGAAEADKESLSDMDAGEGYDRCSLDLLGVQDDLLKAVKATGKPVVVVYIEGRPLDMRWASENANALLDAWYPGMEGGTAIADIIFGDYNPSGRLPISIPRDVGQLPVYYNMRFPSIQGHDYVEGPATPLYEFGYGLSYTDFEYSDLKVEATGRASAKVSFNVRNTGSVAGEEVPQVYVTDVVASTVRPHIQLCGFERVSLQPGESKAVEINLDEPAFSLYDTSMRKVVEPGDFIIRVGASSSDIRLEEKLTLQ